MPITFACDCGKQLAVGDEFAGKRARCPACAAVLAVPSGDRFPAAPPPLPATSEDDAYKLLDDGPPPPLAAPAAMSPAVGGHLRGDFRRHAEYRF